MKSWSYNLLNTSLDFLYSFFLTILSENISTCFLSRLFSKNRKYQPSKTKHVHIKSRVLSIAIAKKFISFQRGVRYKVGNFSSNSAKTGYFISFSTILRADAVDVISSALANLIR